MASYTTYSARSTEEYSSILFLLEDQPGALSRVLLIFQEEGINLTGIKSRPSHVETHKWEFTIDVGLPSSDSRFEKSIQRMSETIPSVRVIGGKVPWFPRKIQDLDSLSQVVLSCGEELSSDHPGFSDEVYRERRKEITEIGRTYLLASGEPIPKIEYNEVELKTWKTVYQSLKQLYPTHACRAHNCVFPLLEKFCGYSEDNIPQLQDISLFLQQATGWRLKPVTGLLTPRDFLNGLAFRVFHSTQYIRHDSVPLYTPEPDVCHELLGHVPLFADPEFAELSQEIGLASLGATDEEIEKLATLYWFTVEFGVCLEDGQKKAYGAGLLSSFGELEYCVTEKPRFEKFDPAVVCKTPYPVTEYQPVYFVASSFSEATQALREFSSKMERPFAVSYNALTQSVEVLDTIHSVRRKMTALQRDLEKMTTALGTLI
mmetsp:Transcript_25941/g.36020  ORF Transcript_25941/g.36020 Transcript_25941/m.36020 type:complete len:431 (+) Transcript_25941:53-1345(+)|eukprot:CAMPEP_0201485258 /NCGR_PEP_ID=MMETSP0151_2-20130828/9369_1 /ASSEMBLY_ACC=CAM_ASM_000257 /TAXON_ID=200890 /ORGANISM="Paramoeba atlantica, Strain 621/1 / CCAP 1560/9" /LENGTH=430 /DNA_ID=CAMNT_0047869301 /DNA_START=58 /DNA_END=1350 /DNA_ORIENTATION=+